jgi:hypothetical protein
MSQEKDDQWALICCIDKYEFHLTTLEEYLENNIEALNANSHPSFFLVGFGSLKECRLRKNILRKKWHRMKEK